MRVAVIGAGWYGTPLAIKLSELGYEVTLYEKNNSIFSGVSGKFGIRLHVGPHYPRSKTTRQGCRAGFEAFINSYPDLVNKHSHSIYALGETDAAGLPPKVTKKQFSEVCFESESCRQIDPAQWGLKNVLCAYNIDEPSMVVGDRLRMLFLQYLKAAHVNLKCNYEIYSLQKNEDGIYLSGNESTERFDFVINATGFQALTPKESSLPFKMEVIYQPCLALLYEDTKQPLPSMPHSFIAMDGWYPCWMPYDERPLGSNKPVNKYIITHGMWTIMGSHKTVRGAQHQLDSVTEQFIQSNVRPNCESELKRFWSGFNNERFRFLRTVGTVLAKIKTDREFRGAVTFQSQETEVIHIIPGKVSNIFDTHLEVTQLLQNNNIASAEGYRYTKNGVLNQAKLEIAEKPKNALRNTCELQTYRQREYAGSDIR